MWDLGWKIVLPLRRYRLPIVLGPRVVCSKREYRYCEELAEERTGGTNSERAKEGSWIGRMSQNNTTCQDHFLRLFRPRTASFPNTPGKCPDLLISISVGTGLVTLSCPSRSLKGSCFEIVGCFLKQ
jgi:hypothetical protein